MWTLTVRRAWLLAVIALVASLQSACAPSASNDREGSASEELESAPRWTVVATTPLVAWLTRELAGKGFAVENLVPAGEDPSAWSPSGDRIASLADSDLVLMHGAELEPWVETASLPRSRTVDTTAGLELLEREGRTHSHGAEGEHAHVGHDPYTWLDPTLVADQAARVAEALDGVDPEGASERRSRLEALRGRLTALADEQRALLAPLAGHSVVIAQGHLSYLLRGSDVEARELDLDPGAPPDGHDAGHLRSWLRSAPVGLACWLESPTDEVRSALPGDVVHVVIDPLLSSRDGRYDYVARHQANLEALRSALGEPAIPGPS